MRTHLLQTSPLAALLLTIAPLAAGPAAGQPAESGESGGADEPSDTEVPSDAVSGDEGAAPAAPPPPTAMFDPDAPSVPFQEVPEHLASLSAQSCNACHPAFHAEWSTSGHGSAWSSPLYQEALSRAEEPAYCLRCHLPLLNQRPTTVRGYDEERLTRPQEEPNPRFDPTLRGEGVTCAACHVRDGVVWGYRSIAEGEAPHPVFHQPDLSNPAFCAACHQLTWPGTEDKPLYDTYREWEASSWGRAGVRCQDCHMPPRLGVVAGTRTAARPSHRILGASDDAMLARALTVQIGTTPPELQRGTELAVQVTVTNTGAGHHVPTGNPHSWIELRVHCDGVEGMDPSPRSWSIRRTIGVEPGERQEVEDTRLAAGAQLVADYAVTPDRKVKAPGTLELVVELVYHRLPPEMEELHEESAGEISRVFHRQVVRIPLR